MMSRNKRIEEFINSLETVESDGCKSILLTTDIGAIGGSENAKACINRVKACGKTTNKSTCVNYVEECKGAENSGYCKQDKLEPEIETNAIFSTCGE